PIRRDEVIAVEVRPIDGEGAAASVTVGNAPPRITSIAVTPDAPGTDDTLACDVATTDAEGDAVTVAHRWTIGPREVGTGPTLPADASRKGDRVTCAATVHDGIDAAEAAAAPVRIVNTPPVWGAPALSGASRAAPLTVDRAGLVD